MLLLLLLFHVVLVVHLSLYTHNYRWTTTKLHNNNNSNSNKKFNLHKLFNLCSDYFCCYHVILLFLFLFIENDRWTTTTKTTQSILHKLLFLQEFTSPIHIPMYDLPLQQLNMKWTNIYKTDLMKYCSWPPDASTRGVHLHLLNCISSKCQANLMHDCKYQADLM